MAHGHAHEEAEHASHHAVDPFDKRVAMTMVVVAAVLACVKVQGHRTHNETLAYQVKANVAHTQESDMWNFFQSKKMREVLARFEAAMLLQTGSKPGGKSKQDPAPSELVAKIEQDLEELTKELQESPTPRKIGPPSEEAKKIGAAGEKQLGKLKKAGVSEDLARRVVAREMTAMRYRAESTIIANRAIGKQELAKKHEEKSEHLHHQAFFFDLGELGVELALVLCSVAILTKRTGFWYSGMGVGLVGLGIVAKGLFMH